MVLFLEKIFRKTGKKTLFFAILLCSSMLNAASRGTNIQEQNITPIRELYSTVEDMRHEVNNHETEIRMFDEKLKNLETIIENLQNQLEESYKFNKEQLKNGLASVESKTASLETMTKGIINDMFIFKTYSNDTAAILAQYKQKISEVEKIVIQQNQNIEHLQAALSSLMEALQIEQQHLTKTDTVVIARSYKVKPGDNLEKIARNHQTTIQLIKEANGLTTDRIVVGQTLVIPDN